MKANQSITVEIDGEMAVVIRSLAKWMRWKPAEVAAALCGASLEGWDGDDIETVQACLNSYGRYCATGRAPKGWQPWLSEKEAPQ